VDHDPWRQWQEFAAQFAATARSAQADAARAGVPDFARFTESAGRFTAAAQAYLNGADQISAAAAEERTRIFSDSLRDLFAELPLRWSPDFGAGGGNQTASRNSWDSPALGATREHQQRWQRMGEAGRRIDEAQRRLQRLWSDALRDAAAAFTARLVQPPPIGVSVEELRKLYDTWIDCAEDAYARIAHSDPFCGALADFMNASSQWRREMQASIEHSAKLLDLPTRSEINSLMQRLRAVENQLRDAGKSRKPKAAVERPRRARRKVKRERR
jgi:class III poly(R)-hydroxyalkanoic acid synthase PhaE subunit